MKIFFEMQPHTELKDKEKKIDNSYWLNLYGVNITKGPKGWDVEPVYVPFVTVHNDGEQLTLVFNFWRMSAIIVYFFSTFPFIWIARNKGVQNEYKELDD